MRGLAPGKAGLEEHSWWACLGQGSCALWGSRGCVRTGQPVLVGLSTAPFPPTFAPVASPAPTLPSPPIWLSKGRGTLCPLDWLLSKGNKGDLVCIGHLLCAGLHQLLHTPHPRGGDIHPTLQVRHQRPSQRATAGAGGAGISTQDRLKPVATPPGTQLSLRCFHLALPSDLHQLCPTIKEHHRAWAGDQT